ncbi:MAG: hypothetical protein L6420_11805 [Elusimicrobia bacterium]|nr:hypothetical protein [Elusimicrobiota bacterium]
MKKLLIMIFLMNIVLPATSSENNFDVKYFTIKSVTNECLDEIKEGTTPLNTGNIPVINPHGINPSVNPQQPETMNTIDKIMNLMEKAFGIIEKNKPVVNTNISYVNAVPYGTSHWTQLQGWSKLNTKKYAFSMKNIYGGEVVKVIYQVHWTYGGNLAGKGKFLTGVTVEPISITVGWGYTVDLIAEVPDSTVANVGTSEDPIASMQVQLNWRVSTKTKVVNEKAIYYVQGDGFMQELASAFSKERTEAKVGKQSIEKDTEKIEVKNLQDIKLELSEERKLDNLSTLTDKLSLNRDNSNIHSILNDFYNGLNSKSANAVYLDNDANNDILDTDNDISERNIKNDKTIYKTHSRYNNLTIKSHVPALQNRKNDNKQNSESSTPLTAIFLSLFAGFASFKLFTRRNTQKFDFSNNSNNYEVSSGNQSSTTNGYYNGENSSSQNNTPIEINDQPNFFSSGSSSNTTTTDTDPCHTDEGCITQGSTSNNNDNPPITNDSEFFNWYCDQGMDGHNANCNFPD